MEYRPKMPDFERMARDAGYRVVVIERLRSNRWLVTLVDGDGHTVLVLAQARPLIRFRRRAGPGGIRSFAEPDDGDSARHRRRVQRQCTPHLRRTARPAPAPLYRVAASARRSCRRVCHAQCTGITALIAAFL